jgi:hypothetical protein
MVRKDYRHHDHRYGCGYGCDASESDCGCGYSCARGNATKAWLGEGRGGRKRERSVK